MALVKTKTGVEIDVVGNANLDSIPHLVCKIPNPLYYQSSILYKYIIIPAHLVHADNGVEWVEVIHDVQVSPQSPQST